MNWMLIAAAVAGLFAAIGHSFLGERFVLRPLFSTRGDNRALANATTRRVVRWVWHLPSFAWATLAAASLWLALHGETDAMIRDVGCVIYATGALANLWAMRRPHVGNIALALAAFALWLGS